MIFSVFKHLQRAFVFFVPCPGSCVFAVNNIHNDIVVSLNSENGKKVAKFAKDSDIRKNGVEYNFAKTG